LIKKTVSREIKNLSSNRTKDSLPRSSSPKGRKTGKKPKGLPKKKKKNGTKPKLTLSSMSQAYL
jgi:hypothetical protein